MLFTGEYPGVDPHEGIPMRGDVSGDICKEAVGKRHLGRGICGETSGTTVVKLGMPWSHMGSPDQTTPCFLTKGPQINLPMWVLGRPGGPCAIDATRDLILFQKTSKNLPKWSRNSGQHVAVIFAELRHRRPFQKTLKQLRRNFQKPEVLPKSFLKTSNATSHKLLKWSRNSGQQVAANFSRVPQSEQLPRSFQNKSENHKCVQTTSNENQQTHKNI